MFRLAFSRLSGVCHLRNTMKQFARRLSPPSPLRMARVLQAAGLALAAAGVLGLGGCASSTDASLIHLTDGQSGYAINCSGADASTTWASCYVLAGEKCGATGYTIVSKDNEEGGPSGATSPT
ncbi:MAG: hypothetical protein CBARDCOR_4392 [uncultured Caballeronia sp.]|nr:MAG: hypothetical protein CBARDCOR_4392 [uncultured Caballeronia sp.]